MRIAIVDDIVSERKALHGRLDIQLARLALHADIFEYANGTDFLLAAKRDRFDLVFLDIYMDGENGIETAECLRFEEILYAGHYQHQIHIHTTNGQKTVTRQTFREFTAALCDERFFLCSRGVIVNLEHAADFDGTDFILRNGERIAVSRSLTKSARLAFGDFLFKRRPVL